MRKCSQHRSDMHQYARPQSLQEDLKCLLESGEGSDVKFDTSNSSSQLFAHSDIIAVRCSTLRPEILAFLSEKQAGNRPNTDMLTIRVRTSSFRALQLVIRYVYTGTIDLEDTHLYDFCVLSEQLGIPSLLQHVFRHLGDTSHSSMILHILDRALNDSKPTHALVGKLTTCLSNNCSHILEHADLKNASLLAMQHLVKQETLGASESEIWKALVKWACYKCGLVRTKQVSLMTNEEHRKVAEHLSPFCRPGHIRILNLETKFFVSEVEPLNLFSHTELLIKYRFDATVGEFPFEATFPKDRYSFLARVRQRCMSFESERHPHPRGTYSEVKVEMPRWVSKMEVTFDERTALGRYADLEFFMDEESTIRVFSLRTSQNEAMYERSPYLTPSALRSHVPRVPKPIQIAGNRFWFTFYAPKNVGDRAWGYRFIVSVLR